IVKRDVVRVVTPGTITDSNILDEKSNNYLISIYMDPLGIGLGYVDNSTGAMYTTEFAGDEEECYRFIVDELGKILPSEMICNERFLENTKYINIIKNRINPYFNIYKDLDGNENIEEERILNFFKVPNLKEIGIHKKIYSIIAINKLIDYL